MDLQFYLYYGLTFNKDKTQINVFIKILFIDFIEPLPS
jgi:hypothetical protein